VQPDRGPPHVNFWHIVSFWALALNGRYRRHSGQWPVRALNGSVAIDPTATLAVHCGNGFDAGFCPLSKYSFEQLGCFVQSQGARYEAAGISRSSGWRGGRVAARGARAEPKLHNWASGKSCSQATRAGKSSCRETVEKERNERGVQKTSNDRKDCASRAEILHILMRKEIV
jgi:hypothetical protein